MPHQQVIVSLLIVAIVAAVHGQICAPDILKEVLHHGGNGVHDPCTNQVLTYNWLPGSEVTQITGTLLCADGGRTCFGAARTTQFPINLNPNGPDVTGSIDFQLPYTMASGKYLARISLSGSTPCTP